MLDDIDIVCWAVKNQEEYKMNIAKMRMMCWMGWHTRQVRIGNGCIRVKIRVAPDR